MPRGLPLFSTVQCCSTLRPGQPRTSANTRGELKMGVGKHCSEVTGAQPANPPHSATTAGKPSRIHRHTARKRRIDGRTQHTRTRKANGHERPGKGAQRHRSHRNATTLLCLYSIPVHINLSTVPAGIREGRPAHLSCQRTACILLRKLLEL